MVVSAAVCSKGGGSVVVDSLLLLLSLNAVLFYVWPFFVMQCTVSFQLRKRELDSFLYLSRLLLSFGCQWRSQNTEKVTHIKGRLLDQAVIHFNWVSFHNGNFTYKKEFAPRGGEFFPLRAVPYGMEIHVYHIR